MRKILEKAGWKLSDGDILTRPTQDLKTKELAVIAAMMQSLIVKA